MSEPLDQQTRQQDQLQTTTNTATTTNTSTDLESSTGGTRDTNSGTGKTGYELQGEDREGTGAEKR